MSKGFQAVWMTIVMVLVTLSILVSFAPLAAAASHTWTTDVDFTQAGAGGTTPIFNGVEVVASGPPAHIDNIRSSTDWANKTPPGSPSARTGAGFAFSTYDNLGILFAGYGRSEMNDTWEYNYSANTWTRVSTDPTPSGREVFGSAMMMAYDSSQRVVVLFGGTNNTDGFLADTWEYNVVTKTWTNRTPPTSPPALIAGALAYCTSTSRSVLFGHSFATDQMTSWEYNAGTHTWQQYAGSMPSRRDNFGMAYHAALDRVVLFGGHDRDPPIYGTSFSDTWEYNCASHTWSEQSPPSWPAARLGHAMTYRSSSTSVLLFGGAVDFGGGNVEYRPDTWQYTSSRAWQQLTTPTVPPGRIGHGFAYDPKDDVAILTGGETPTGDRLKDTWTLGAAYGPGGFYVSAVFDSGAANTVWGTIWWNKTPANQPPNTFLWLQIAVGDSPTGMSSPGGPPSCGASQYFYAPGTIPNCFNTPPHRYLLFKGTFGTNDTQVTPSLEDLTITYTIPPAPPYIVVTDPYNAEFNVEIERPINVTFSEPMNIATVSCTVTAVTPPGAFVPTFTPSWSQGNSRLSLTHAQPFREAAVYRVTCVGQDTDTPPNNLVPNPYDSSIVNPWIFVTQRIYPWIASTIPAQGAKNVANASSIVIFRMSSAFAPL